MVCVMFHLLLSRRVENAYINYATTNFTQSMHFIKKTVLVPALITIGNIIFPFPPFCLEWDPVKPSQQNCKAKCQVYIGKLEKYYPFEVIQLANVCRWSSNLQHNMSEVKILLHISFYTTQLKYHIFATS